MRTISMKISGKIYSIILRKRGVDNKVKIYLPLNPNKIGYIKLCSHFETPWSQTVDLRHI